MRQSLEEESKDTEGLSKVNLGFINWKPVLCTLELYNGKVPSY